VKSQTIPIPTYAQLAGSSAINMRRPARIVRRQSAQLDRRIQRFENGLMIYVNANGLNRIYGLQNSEALHGRCQRLNGDHRTVLCHQTLHPGQMFNWAYYNTLAPIAHGTALSAGAQLPSIRGIELFSGKEPSAAPVPSSSMRRMQRSIVLAVGMPERGRGSSS
jgi:hypothetical protein